MVQGFNHHTLSTTPAWSPLEVGPYGAAGLIGGLGLAPGANYGESVAVFEAIHGSAPDIAGQGIANPTGLLMSGCMMLDHIGQADVATRIRKAVDSVIRDGENRTTDMGGKAGTVEYTDAIVRALED